MVCHPGKFFDGEGVDDSDGEESGRENFHKHGLNDLLSGSGIAGGGGGGVESGDDDWQIKYRHRDRGPREAVTGSLAGSAQCCAGGPES